MEKVTFSKWDPADYIETKEDVFNYLSKRKWLEVAINFNKPTTKASKLESFIAFD